MATPNFYITTTNADQTEGRGWTIPTMISRSLNYALTYSQNNPRGYGYDYDDIYVFAGEPNWTHFYSGHFKKFLLMPEMETPWVEFLNRTEERPPLAEKPELITVYGLVSYRDRTMGGPGGSLSKDEPSLEAIYESYEEALKNWTEGQGIYAIETEHDYRTQMFKNGHESLPVPVTESEETVNEVDAENARLQELTRMFS